MTTQEEDRKKVEERRTGTSLIHLGNDNIIRVLFIRNSQITPETLKEDHKVYMALANKRTHAFLFDAEEGVDYTPAARDFASRLSSAHMSAVAVVVRSLGYRLIAEFYYKIHKPPVPYKVFSSAEEAEDWLKLYS